MGSYALTNHKLAEDKLHKRTGDNPNKNNS